MSEPKDWLDAQTKAQLLACPPKKLAPPVVAGYSLVLLERGPDRQRVDRTLQELVGVGSAVPRGSPCVVRRDLSLTDSLQGQFELICADSVSVFVDDEILRNANQRYLDELFQALRESPEFQPVQVRIDSVPPNDDGTRFLRQFFGEILWPPIVQTVARKKARIMQHWAAKFGAVVECGEESG